MAFGRVPAGRSWRLSSQTVNTLSDTVREWNASKNDLQTPRKTSSLPHGSIVEVVNNSGTNFQRFSAVGLDAPLITPSDNQSAFEQSLSFTLRAPTTADKLTFAIAQENIPDGTAGRVLIDGITNVQANVTNTLHKWLELDTGTPTVFVSTFKPTPLQLLWFAGGTGTQWCRARLGSPTGTWFYAGKTTSPVTAGSTGSVTLYDKGISTGATITAHLDWMHGSENISSGKEVVVAYFALEDRWRFIASECEA